MAGYIRQKPGRQVFDEIISTGASVGSGITGVTSKYLGTRWSKWTGPFQPPSTSAYIMAITVSSSNSATTVTTSLGTPDFARAVRLAPTTSQVATGNVVVSGTNQFDVTVSDTIALGGTGAPVNGVIPFKTITSVVIPASTSGTGTQAAFSLTIGQSNVFGLDRQITTVAAAIRGVVNGLAETTAPIMNSTNHTASFTTAATSSAGATLELIYLHADVSHS